ncbi:MAG TPA: DUF222 domain-containing protein [Actinoplanes sp.]
MTRSLQAVHRWEQSLAVLKARLAGEAAVRGIPATEGHRSLTGWLQSRLRVDQHVARQLTVLADALRRRPAVEQAVLDGLLDIRQAMEIATAVNSIPDTLNAIADDASPTTDPNTSPTSSPTTSPTSSPTTDPNTSPTSSPTADIDASLSAGSAADPTGNGDADPVGPDEPGYAGMPDGTRIADDAEAMLIGMAHQFTARGMRKLGERILAHVAPEMADRADEAALRRQEARAQAKRSFTLHQPLDGMVRISGSLDVEAAAIVQAALQPLCVPSPGDDRSPAQKRADALVEVCKLASRTGDLPDHGGEPPQVAVTIRHEALVRRLGAAVLDNGERLSAAAARRMACDARILPIVLGGAGQVLDAGRSRRLASGPLRRALVTRDRGCTFPACDRPSRWCDAHHLRQWANGGPTDLDNLTLLCRHHHRILHDPAAGWRVRLGSDGIPEFIPPPWIDILQRPQRNLYHPRT